jgi:NAD(P)-dependent dehydrogenase (short-subunit alcohol dehydrogenase family)
MSSITGRVYTVTGAASGIGQAVAIRLAELGADGLALSDVDEAGLDQTKKLCNLPLLREERERYIAAY